MTDDSTTDSNTPEFYAAGTDLTPSYEGSVPGSTRPHHDWLYDDEYVQVTDTHVILKTYYFPFGTSKKIPFEKIERIYTDKEYNLDLLGYKAWGMGMSDVWWAYAMPRTPHNYIIRVRDAWPRCGFSVENHSAFSDVLAKKGVPGAHGKDL